MPYCDACTADANPDVRGLTIPMSMFELDREHLLELMYRGDATRTVPDIVAEMLHVPAGGDWFAEATYAVEHPTTRS
jgi:hypothetical protein